MIAAALALVVTPSAISSAAEIAAASAADWFCRWIQNHHPTSTPSPANPISTGSSTATATATAPRRSRQNRAQIGRCQSAALLTIGSRGANQLASGPGASGDRLLEKIDHAQYQWRADHDHHRRQYKPHQREGQQDREARGTLFVACQAFGAHFGGEHAQ